MGDWWVSSTVIIHKYEFSGTAQILDIPLNLASPMLPTSASCMKTFQFTLQNWRNDSILGQTGDSGQFHPCCCLQIICDTPLRKYLDTSVTMGHLCKYSNVAVSAKKSTHRMCEMCESSLCKKISTKNLWKNHTFSGGVNRQLSCNHSKKIKTFKQKYIYFWEVQLSHNLLSWNWIREDLNLCGQRPTDFKSALLTTLALIRP